MGSQNKLTGNTTLAINTSVFNVNQYSGGGALTNYLYMNGGTMAWVSGARMYSATNNQAWIQQALAGGGTTALIYVDSTDAVLVGSGVTVKLGSANFFVDTAGKLTAANAVLTAAAPTVAAAQVGLGSTTATSASAGANGDVPAQVLGYIIANVAGTTVKIPYYAA
jgi:hypothetical protein